MSQAVPPSPQPDLHQRPLESLEEQLRALPPPTVPAALPAKLIAALPATAATATFAAGSAKLWLWLVGIGAAVVLLAALMITGLTHSGSNAPPEPKPAAANSAATANSTLVPAAVSKTIENYQQAVTVDPYNADAWFNLAKAQAAAQLSADAISSAKKAIDIAHSRNQTTFVSTIEAWLRSYRATLPGQSAK
ncbi:MAG TPA: tetratricopeptide repeat protein [Pirellulales bacterium]|jgi:tetratricopeptide (TPR) repeat protein|nr:tetratricopeptide repeat protein [Pirellulales bacterium]